MNTVLLSNGYDGLIIPHEQEQSYNKALHELFIFANLQGWIDFMLNIYINYALREQNRVQVNLKLDSEMKTLKQSLNQQTLCSIHRSVLTQNQQTNNTGLCL